MCRTLPTPKEQRDGDETLGLHSPPFRLDFVHLQLLLPSIGEWCVGDYGGKVAGLLHEWPMVNEPLMPVLRRCLHAALLQRYSRALAFDLGAA